MTLEEILQRIGSYVDQDSATPTSTDLTIRTQFVNLAYEEWAMAYDWNELRTRYEFTTTQASQMTISLPTDFKKLSTPLYYWESANLMPREYQLVPQKDAFTRPYSDEFVYIQGDRTNGYNLVAPKGFPSGASLTLEYQKMPTSLATLSDQPIMASPNFLIQRGIAYVLESRGDTRFPTAKADSERIIANLVEHQNNLRIGGGNGRVRDYYTESNFRIGRR